eukprot:TRINITY_DN2756_c1_g1_i2.p1 TRINITY_DN2756_c1_g1~~TRINITY_DN2756_c1_g1_i2.p1  ORF type:complete len:462 (-),score=71.55 TRINITY_DN2756_c1_g1_i2:145-1530(-)
MRGIIFIIAALALAEGQYEPNWDSINSRPLPDWYDEAKLGIMVVWGIYSVPSWGNWTEFTYSPDAAWYWHRLMFPYTDNYSTYDFHEKTYGMSTTYQDFVEDFTAEMWDPNKMANIIAQSGAKYMVITSQSHDGFAMWPSAQSWNWNSVDIGPKRDVVGELASAVRQTDVRFGLYHSLYEWFNPLYLQDNMTGSPPKTQVYIDEVLMPQLKDMVNRYEPEIVWSDGDWEQPSSYWNSTTFLAWLYNESGVKETVVVNDRWGYDCRNRNGGYYTPWDGYNPGHVQAHKWEDSATIGTSYGFNRHEDLSQFSTATQLLQVFTQVVSTGGNMILGVGPERDGRIPVIIEERLLQLGAWLQQNGEAIYSTVPWRAQNDTAEELIWYTQAKNSSYVYAIFFEWPADGTLSLTQPVPSSDATAELLGNSGLLKWTYEDDVMGILLPAFSPKLASQQSVWALRLGSVK